MISFIALMLPLIIKNTRLSFLSTAFMTILLSMNLLVQFQMVLGETSLKFQQSSSSSVSESISDRKSVAWISTSRIHRKSSTFPTRLTSADKCRRQPTFVTSSWMMQRLSPPFALSSSTLPQLQSIDMEHLAPSHRYRHSQHRRSFFSNALWSTAALVASSSLPLSSSATAINGTAPDVDWDAFGAQLQQTSSFSSPQSSPSSSSSTGGSSDLQDALKKSEKQRVIDPRTHG